MYPASRSRWRTSSRTPLPGSGRSSVCPSEAAIIAADIATKTAGVSIGFVDRFSGSLLITGDVASVEASLRAVLELLCRKMGFTPTEITRS